MSADQADSIQELLSRLMAGVRQNPTLTAEVARAEREFFQANPATPTEDPAALFRFQEWYLLERESEVLGDVPIACPVAKNAIPEDDYEAIADSLAGVFLVTGSTAAEYTLQDLQSDEIFDLSRIDGVDLTPGDVLVGRLFLGQLDIYIASTALCAQRDATALADAFRSDMANLGLERRLTQAEIEHLMFRGRGTGVAESDQLNALDREVPLERLEADLEACLGRGGVGELSATDVSAALATAVRPGMVMNPLLEQLAFDTDVDLEQAQQLMVQIWTRHQAEPAQRAAPPVAPPKAPPMSPPKGPPKAPPAAAPEADEPPRQVETRVASDVAAPTDEGTTLGAEVARRLQQAIDNDESMADAFADIDEMVGGEEPTDAAESLATTPTDGDLRPLITEYLWETGRKGCDQDVLEQMVAIQCETSVPRLDLEAVTSLDLMRLLLQTYLAAPPGERTQALGEAFAVISRFYDWVEETQKYDIRTVLDEARAGLVDHAVRLEAAALALGGNAPEAEPTRGLYRVVQVGLGSVDIAPVDDDRLVRVLVPSRVAEIVAQNLCEEDLLLGELGVADAGHGVFAGMVVAMPALAHELLG